MTDRHPDKQNGMTIRLILCERDAITSQIKKSSQKLQFAAEIEHISVIMKPQMCHVNAHRK